MISRGALEDRTVWGVIQTEGVGEWYREGQSSPGGDEGQVYQGIKI